MANGAPRAEAAFGILLLTVSVAVLTSESVAPTWVLALAPQAAAALAVLKLMSTWVEFVAATLQPFGSAGASTM